MFSCTEFYADYDSERHQIRLFPMCPEGFHGFSLGSPSDTIDFCKNVLQPYLDDKETDVRVLIAIGKATKLHFNRENERVYIAKFLGKRRREVLFLSLRSDLKKMAEQLPADCKRLIQENAKQRRFTEPADIIQIGWKTSNPFPAEWLDNVSHPPAPPSAPLTPEQLLLVSLILAALEQFQKYRELKDKRWLLQDRMYLLAYLPQRLQRKKRLAEVVNEIENGKKFNFRLNG